MGAAGAGADAIPVDGPLDGLMTGEGRVDAHDENAAAQSTIFQRAFDKRSLVGPNRRFSIMEGDFKLHPRLDC